MTRTEKRRLFIASLIYPAFLGNMSYVAAEKLFLEPGFFTCVTTALVIALLLHYVMDWLHTCGSNPLRYLPAQLLWDFLIVVCLYVALWLALEKPEPLTINFWRPLQEPAAWLLATKLFAVMWEAVSASVYQPWRWFAKEHLGVQFDLYFGIAYLLVTVASVYGWGSKSGIATTLVLVLLFDAFSYHVFARLTGRS